MGIRGGLSTSEKNSAELKASRPTGSVDLWQSTREFLKNSSHSAILERNVPAVIPTEETLSEPIEVQTVLHMKKVRSI